MTRSVNEQSLLPKILPVVYDLIEEALNQGREISFKVTSDSMNPTIQVHDTVVIRRVASDELKEGDTIITYRAGRSYVSHRLVRKEKVDGEYRFITKGDNRDHVDTGDVYPVTPDRLLGKVVRIVRDGEVVWEEDQPCKS